MRLALLLSAFLQGSQALQRRPSLRRPSPRVGAREAASLQRSQALQRRPSLRRPTESRRVGAREDAYASYSVRESTMLPRFLQKAQADLDLLLGKPLRPPRVGGGYSWPSTANERIWDWWLRLAGPWARQEEPIVLTQA